MKSDSATKLARRSTPPHAHPVTGLICEGPTRGPSHLSIVYEPNHHTDDSFRLAIANGVPQHHWNFGAMEPVDGLSDNEVEAVIAFIRSEQVRLGFEE